MERQSLFYGTLAEIRQRTNSICLRANTYDRRRGAALEELYVRDWIDAMRTHLDTLEKLMDDESRIV